MSSRVAPFGYPRINGYLLLPEAFRSLSRPSSAPDAKAFPLRSFQLDLSPFSQRLVREFLVLFENYAGFTKIEIVCHPASFRMLFHNQFVSSCVSTETPLCCLTCFCHIVQFSRCRSPSASFRLSPAQLPTAFAVRFEDPIFSIRSSNPKANRLVGPSGLEPPTLRLSVVRSSQLSYGPSSWTRCTLYSLGGDSRVRTGDLLLARQALSQLSYIPFYLPAYAL